MSWFLDGYDSQEHMEYELRWSTRMRRFLRFLLGVFRPFIMFFLGFVTATVVIARMRGGPRVIQQIFIVQPGQQAPEQDDAPSQEEPKPLEA